MSSEIEELYDKAEEAFKEIEHWPQEKVDEMVAAVGWNWQKEENVKEVAKLAVEEAGMGVYENKVSKIANKVRGTLWDFRDAKTCGVVEETKNMTKLAKPMGVVANVTPSTNPEGTVYTVGLGLLKTRNAMVVSPHPRTPKNGALAVQFGREALEEIGAPPDLLQCIEEPNHEKASELMSACDFVVGTGSEALVEIVYKSGTPNQTVGAGNVVSIVDETADVSAAADKIVRSKLANYSISCSSENGVAMEESIYDEMMDTLKSKGGYLCNKEEQEKLREAMWPDGEHLNRDIVGQPANDIADIAEIDVPGDTKFIMVLGEKAGPEDRFSGEKLSEVLTVWKWENFDEMIERLKKMLEFTGRGHSASIHTEREERIMKLAEEVHVSRVQCNMPHALVNSGSWHSEQKWTETLGCGTWQGSMTSDNVNWRHFLNYTRVFTPGEEKEFPSDEELFGEYLDEWGEEPVNWFEGY